MGISKMTLKPISRKKYCMKCLGGLSISMLLMLFVLQKLVYYPLYSDIVTFLKKNKQEIWEDSLPGDYKTCCEIGAILFENEIDEGAKSSKVFTWRTPSFLRLFNHSINENKIENITHFKRLICSRYNYNLHFSRETYFSQYFNTKEFVASPVESTFFVKNHSLALGETIHIQITTRNWFGERAGENGGDFFKIRAENPSMRTSVAASHIVHQGRGVYDVEIKTFWSGLHEIKVFFGQSAYFIDLLKRLTSKRISAGMSFKGGFRRKDVSNAFEKTSERTECHITPLALQSSQDLCNFSREFGETWYCKKPSNVLSCEGLYSIYTTRRRNALDLFTVFSKFDRGSSDQKLLSGNQANLFVNNSSTKENLRFEEVPKCRAGLKTPKPSGYWMNDVWISRVCKNVPYSKVPAQKEKCLRDRTLYFIGDSTARQWFEYFVISPNFKCFVSSGFNNCGFIAKETLSFVNIWEQRTAVLSKLNTTFHYRSHGQPLQNGGPYFATKFVSAQLDEIPSLSNEGSLLTIILAMGPHFVLFNPDVFLERIITVRNAAFRLLKRNPKATIIFKGTSTFIRGKGIGECCLSDWLSFRFHKLAKHIFDGTPVIYLDVWDMTLSHTSQDLIHPVREVVENEIDMALSFSCS